MLHSQWQQGQIPSSYSIVIPPFDSNEKQEISNPPVIEGEDFIALLQTGKIMPMWSGKITQQFADSSSQTRNVVGQYQLVFPYSSTLVGVYRFKGIVLNGNDCELEMVDIFTGTVIKMFLHDVMANDINGLTLLDELDLAVITPVFSCNFNGNIDITPRQFSLPALLESNVRYTYNANGNSYVFKVRLSTSDIKLVPYAAKNLVRIDVCVNTAPLTASARNQTFIIEAEFVNETSLGGEHDLKPILERVRQDFMDALQDKITTVKSITVFSTFLDTFTA